MEQETKQLTIAIIDYGMGNIRSVRNALELLHCEPRIFDEPEGLIDVDAIVLPAVKILGPNTVPLEISFLKETVTASESPKFLTVVKPAKRVIFALLTDLIA